MKSIDEILKERAKIVRKNICYLNDKGEIVEKQRATKYMITEYDCDDKLINEIFGMIEEENKTETEEER